MPTRVRDIYIISDLHLGGAWPSGNERGFRMMTRPAELTAFISSLADRPADGDTETELVINGDFIDFLAEEHSVLERWLPFRYDPADAVTTLRTMAERPEDAPVFGALGELVRRGHRLTVLLGNHDVELALPAVRVALNELMKVRGGWRFYYDGEAYPIAPGILIEHGNRYDPANVIDHDGLRRLRSLQSRSQHHHEAAVAHYTPPPGSRLVAEVMNPIKAQYPFIDLLKPESEPLFALLMALEPNARKVLGRLALEVLDMTNHMMKTPALPSYAGDVSAMGTGLGPAVDVAAMGISDPDEAALIVVVGRAVGTRAAAAFVAQASALAHPGDAYAQDIASGVDSILSKVGLLRLLAHGNLAALEERIPMVQQALRAIRGDQTFDDQTEVGTRYRRAAEELSMDHEGALRHRYVIFGHTHHAKDLTLATGARYLNSGTWANLMRFPVTLVDGDRGRARAALLEFLEDLRESRLDRYIEFRPTYVRLLIDAGGEVAEAGLHDFDVKKGRLDSR